MRVESDRKSANGGWIHRLDGAMVATPPPPARTRERTNTAPPTLERDINRFRAQVKPDRVTRFGSGLGVSAESLHHLWIGWASARDMEVHFPKWKRPPPAWTFPVRKPDGAICGLRIRTAGGVKRGCYPSGLILPTPAVDGEFVAIVEGETDAAAALDLGLAVVGLPGCQSC